MKNLCKSKGRTIADVPLLSYFDLKQNKRINIRIARIESFVTLTISATTRGVGGSDEFEGVTPAL